MNTRREFLFGLTVGLLAAIALGGAGLSIYIRLIQLCRVDWTMVWTAVQAVAVSGGPPATWTYIAGYIVQLIVGAAVIGAALVAFNAAIKSASKQAKGALAAQRFVERATKVRQREERLARERAIRKQVVAMLEEASFSLVGLGVHPDASEGTLVEPLQRLAARAYDLDVASAFPDNALRMLYAAGTSASLFVLNLRLAQRPLPNTERVRFARLALGLLDTIERVIRFVGEPTTDLSEYTRRLQEIVDAAPQNAAPNE